MNKLNLAMANFAKLFPAGTSLAQQRIAGSKSEDNDSAMFLDAFEDLGQRGMLACRWI
jgi:hypothetical protein